jgi:hypothetical protein
LPADSHSTDKVSTAPVCNYSGVGWFDYHQLPAAGI